MNKQIVECVPNFSEGNNPEIIRQITNAIESVEGVMLLHVDMGKATNRTVVTFAGEPAKVVEAAFLGISKAAELIDMRHHKGEHPRMGATDVCPLVPVSGITMEACADWSRKLGERVGKELGIPVYLYEEAQPNKNRSNLSVIRGGEYEGFTEKIKLPEWKPDFGPAELPLKHGATVIGARDFLIAYNINLNTKSTRIANRIAFDVREAGRVKREGNPITGKVVTDANGEPVRIPGTLKAVKAIGWYIEEYGMAQISMNLINYKITSVHKAFDEVCSKADERGVRVTGSELVGLVPLQPLLDAGKHYLSKQGRSIGVSDEELIEIAVQSLGLNQLGEFKPEERIIEYVLRDKSKKRLIDLSVKGFINETAADSPAPGGGSVSALCAALGVSLGAMVANLSADKRGWESKTEFFSNWAEKAQKIKEELMYLIDEDTNAFNGIMSALQMPKTTPEEKNARALAIESASIYATEIPLKTMQVAYSSIDMLEAMIVNGNPNSITDAGVGLLCIKTAVRGAYFNVLVNAKGLNTKEKAIAMANEAKALLKDNHAKIDAILQKVEEAIAF
ncbi:MAG: glutamate formimidoyltransferase [Bacteroidetes bacterium]|nr:glutamate formimidoyltransferase [Bacteroidota bacterium]